MFWEKWIPEKQLFKSTVCGLEILLTDSGSLFFYTILQSKKNKLTILESGSSEEKLVLPAIISQNKIPLVVCIVGKGLISKKVTVKDQSFEEVLNQNLPAITLSEFYIQLYQQLHCDGFLSLFRKEQVDSVIEILKQTKLEIANVFLGYAFVSDTMPLVTLFNSIKTNGASLEFSNSCLESIRQTPIDDIIETLDIEGISLTNKNVLGFALCFTYLLNTNHCHNYYEELKQYKTKHLEKAKLKVLTYSLVGITFTISLFNFFFFSYYFDMNNKLGTELNLYEDKYKKIDELLDSYEKKKTLIEESGIFNPNCIVKYESRIAGSLPKEVILTKWVLNPSMKIEEEDSLIKFQKNIILIEGVCNKSSIINEWVNVLKTQNYVKDVNLEKFNFNTEGNQPNFELKIVTE